MTPTMHRPQPGDVVPIVLDDLGPGRKIGLLLVYEIDEAADYLEPDEQFLLLGRVLRRSYFEGRDPLVIDDGDEWSESNLCAVWGSDLLPPMPVEYRDGIWDGAGHPIPDDLANVGRSTPTQTSTPTSTQASP
jgi:hypothetical protein